MGEVQFEDRDYDAAVTRGTAERAAQPRPVAVRYDAQSGRVIVEFDNGSAFMVPAALLQGLAGASDEELGAVTLLGETGLHWPSRDVDLTIAGIMQGVFGTTKFMEASRKGGQSRSAAKAEAARLNGQRGGRPRKSS